LQSYALQGVLVALVLFLLLNLSGCASRKPAIIPNGDSDFVTDDELVVLEVGCAVRVVLNSGEVVRGQLEEISSNEIVVELRQDFITGKRVIEKVDIDVIEEEGPPTMSSIVVGTALAVVSVLFLFNLMMSNANW